MKAAVMFTGGGPVLFLTSYDSLEHPQFLAKLSGRGIKKFIAYEVPMEKVKEKYGKRYLQIDVLHRRTARPGIGHIGITSRASGFPDVSWPGITHGESTSIW